MNGLKVASVAALAAIALTAQSNRDLSPDEAINKSIAAYGGLEKLNAIKTIKCTGKVIFTGGHLEAPLVLRSKRPFRYRTEITMQGQQMVEAFDGATKWIVSGGNPNPQKSPEDSAKSAADNADIVESPLIHFKEKGHTLEQFGKEDVDGAPAYKFRLKLKSGNLLTVYLDMKSFLTVKTVTLVKQAGPELEAESKPGNFKRVEGVMIAFSNAIRINQQPVMQMIYDKVEVNVPMDDSLFAFPQSGQGPTRPAK